MHPKYCQVIMRLHGEPVRCGPWASNLAEWVGLASLFAPFRDTRRTWTGRVGLDDLRDPLSYRVRPAAWDQRLSR